MSQSSSKIETCPSKNSKNLFKIGFFKYLPPGEILGNSISKEM